MYMYVYIYIYRERERYTYIYIYIYMKRGSGRLALLQHQQQLHELPVVLHGQGHVGRHLGTWRFVVYVCSCLICLWHLGTRRIRNINKTRVRRKPDRQLRRGPVGPAPRVQIDRSCDNPCLVPVPFSLNWAASRRTSRKDAKASSVGSDEKMRCAQEDEEMSLEKTGRPPRIRYKY